MGSSDFLLLESSGHLYSSRRFPLYPFRSTVTGWVFSLAVAVVPI